jgi:hypothetical protein
VCVEDVDRLQLSNDGGDLLVNWIWPDGASHVLVGWRMGLPPKGLDDPAAKKLRVDRHEYQSQGKVRLTDLKSGRYYVRAWSCYPTPEGEVMAAGTSRGCQANAVAGPVQQITYKMTRQPLRGYWRLSISGEPGLRLPALTLVAKRGTFVPTAVTDGTVVKRFEPLELTDGLHMVRLDDLPRDCTCRLFFADEAEYSSFLIEHPARAQDTRVG